MGEWTFFSNHGHVLVCLARDREARLRDVALQVGITERAVQKIVKDMQDAGYLEISKHGRRNRYRINNRKSLRHVLQTGCTVGQLVQLLNKQSTSRPETKAEPETVEPRAVEPAEVEAAPVQEPDVVEEVVAQTPEAPEPEAPEPEAPEPEAPEPEAPMAEVATPEPTPEPQAQEPEASEPEKPQAEKSKKKPSKADLEQGQLF